MDAPDPRLALLDDALARLEARAAETRRLKAVLKRARTALARPSAKPGRVIAKLVTELRALPDAPAPAVPTLVQQLEALGREPMPFAEPRFRQEVAAACAEAGLACRPLPAGLVVGPFLLTVDVAAQQGTLHYAKSAVRGGLPLEAGPIVAAVLDLRAALLAPVPNVPTLAAEVLEALRVAAARLRLPASGRVPLPALYRELALLRAAPTVLAGQPVSPYPAGRFVVELKTLVQSDHNLSATPRLKLEPAVIDAAGQAQQSLFFPHDLQAGHGEGMYYQAAVLV